ncbi:hypothetical protein IWW34DRAFT_823717 [Fusarium oxysporum f. sp. albedinis]|nr:hypothetical protein IWW34DRAFT_823717 [Fusarium oxysporum f. sp. albedinis]
MFLQDPTQPRSIFFIGHSLGGLVIKEVNDRSIPSDIILTNVRVDLECLVPLVKDNPNRALLESLNKNSPLLERLQIEFDRILQARKITVVSFYETERSPTAAWVNGKWEMSGPSEVLVEVFSATCGCQKQHPINRNNSEMVKYSGVHDELYRRVIIALRPVLGISQGRSGTGSIGGGSQVSYPSDTCEWLLEDSKYQAWMNKSYGLFWIKGCPGTGKSVLMKFAVGTMNHRKSGEIVVSFFIHGRGVPLQRTPLGMLRALLNSLLRTLPTYLAELTERFQDQQQRYGSYEQKGGWRWNEKELEKFLARLLIEGTKEQPVVIFVDALDECGENYAKSLLVSFKSLMGKAEHEGSLVRICFSSRHFPILGHETMSRVYVEEKNDKDIRLVIEDRLKELQPDEKRRQIENEILLKAHGGFQWAILITIMILDEDATGARTEDLLGMIPTIPPDLDELYNVILNGTTKDKHSQMTKLFQWVLFAERPLSAQELREALATDKDMTCMTISELRSHGNWSDNVSQFEMRVRHISRGRVEFQTRDVWEQYDPEGEEWNREAQFIHQSAADFITQQFLTRAANGGSISMSPAGAGHFEISRSFLRYLTLEEVLNGGNLSREKLCTTFPLMPYGVAFVLRHIRAVEQEGIPQDDLISLNQWDQPERLGLLARIWRIMDPESTHAPRGWPFLGATVLHLVIAFGSATLLDTFLQRDESDLDAQDSEGNTPLQLALREDRQDLALMILDRSRTWQNEQESVDCDSPTNGLDGQRQDYLAHINAFNGDDETPLGLAVSVRADKVIKSLIEAGAEVKHEKSLVFYTISTENKTMLSRLIETGADLKGAVFFAIQCLNRTNHHDILHDLLADLLKAGDFLASRNGRAEVVSLLLSHGASAMLTNEEEEIPLLAAIASDHLETVKVLLRASPQQVLWQTNNGQTLVDVAVEGGHIEIAQLLLNKGDGSLTLQQTFNQAVAQNEVVFVQALISREESAFELVEQSCKGEDAPFVIAVRKGYYEIAKMLLDTGKVDFSDETEWETLFSFSIMNGDENMVKLLLDTGRIGINKLRIDGGRTPLIWAADNGDEAAVKLLLETGKAEVYAVDGWGDTALSVAVQRRYQTIIDLLSVYMGRNFSMASRVPDR